jgi:hypothetical protein
MTSSDEPRWLDTEATAKYLSVRPDALQRLVRQGRIPEPSYGLGPRRPRWDRCALDAIFDGGVASTDPRIASKAVVEKILSAGRKSRQAHAG